MVEMSVAGVALDAISRSPIVLLRDPSSRRQVPIWIDQSQAYNIMAGLQDIPPLRPLSHDLMATLLVVGGLKLDRVIVHSIEDNTFHAVLRLRIDSDDAELNNNEMEFIELDARPSDAIALAVRTGCSIWMLEEVVAEASIAVDAEADAEDQIAFNRFIDDLSPAALVRHLDKRGRSDQDPSDTNLPPSGE
ncbi:bifunctional nuclease family protein [Synechococcus sp. M16CYN]|uniref:bifunctional nuclease family protein n=1 Tax=Synechococcus sp. M16CYN TaxID=3103139 RepID=UPI0032535519